MNDIKKNVDIKISMLIDKKNELERVLELMNVQKERIKNEEIALNKKKELLLKEIEESEDKKRIEDKQMKVEPLISESKEALKKLNESHVSEIKVMSSPPQIIKYTIECVFYLLEGISKIDWNGLLLYIKRTL